MKNKIILGVVCYLACMSPQTARSQTINWGSPVFSDLRDSTGAVLDENTFIFELGSFANNFIPTADNTAQWLANWQVFDRAAYNQDVGYFTGTTVMTDDGLSASPYLTQGAMSFEGLQGFIWVRNGDTPTQGTEWLLAHATDWVFPNAHPGCCDNDIPVEWSVSDFGGETPVWGRQGDQIGSGTYTVTGTHTLQTFTFIPEPSSALLAMLASCLGVCRRRRMRS